jgi:hypothetical protein
VDALDRAQLWTVEQTPPHVLGQHSGRLRVQGGLGEKSWGLELPIRRAMERLDNPIYSDMRLAAKGGLCFMALGILLEGIGVCPVPLADKAALVDDLKNRLRLFAEERIEELLLIGRERDE